MATFTQETRLARLEGPSDTDELLLVRFSGEEAVSRLFRFHLEVQAEKSDIDPKKVLRKSGTIVITLPDGSDRFINGSFSRFSQGASDGELTTYWAELVPWTYYLSLGRDCRIFQKKSVSDILSSVFKKAGFDAFEFRCADRPVREFCVQYRESDFNFMQRLLEEEGIFYFFEHEAGKHTLILADQVNQFSPCPDPSKVSILTDSSSRDNVVTSLEWENSVRIGTVTYRDYDHLQPSFTLEGEAPGDQGEEVYEYWPGHYTTREEGERLAKYRLEAEEALREQARGRGYCRNFIAGHKFELEEHTNSRANQEYVLTSVRHTCSTGDYRSSGSDSFDYTNDFTCIPTSLPFRQRRTASKSLILGTQTAVVVGPAGEEIYTDEHGRVKLHFHWDRLGKKDENSSCWVRVSYPWAGQGWGAVAIPRIGQEVIVAFLEGDPDQPIIVGRVYNAQQVPPYTLPDNMTHSGIKSRSTKGGTAENFNEIRMQDLKGSELLYIHAEKDQTITVEHDRSDSVGHDESRSIENDRSDNVGNNEIRSVGKDQKISIGANRTETVEKNETITVNGNRTESVAGNESIDVDKDRKITIGGDEVQKIAKERKVDVSDNDTLKVGKKLMITAADEITLKAGDAIIQLKKDGTIVIKGKDIKIQASGKISAKASSDITLKGSQVKQN